MATPIYFPKVSALHQTPRIYPPQDNSGINALSAGLGAITSVANNWREKERAVEQAKRTADALEREGLSQEANLYRAAADNFAINYFATPEENQKFNKSLISDTLKLLENKQDRDIKRMQLEESLSYKQALIDNMAIDNRRASEEFGFRREEAGFRREDRIAAQEARDEGKRVSQLQGQERILNPQLQQNQSAQKQLMDARRKGAISQDEFARQMSPLKEQESKLFDAMDSLQRAALGETASSLPKISRGMGRIPEVESEADEAARLNAEAAAFAETEGKKYPGLKELRFRGEKIANPHFSGTTTTTTGQDVEGRPYSRSSTTVPNNLGIKPRAPVDQGLFDALNLK